MMEPTEFMNSPKIDEMDFDTEAVLSRRKKDAVDDSPSSWLITFADLMTILLVFTFVLFVTNMNDAKKTRQSADQKSDKISSMVTQAHADTTKTGTETTIYLTNQNHTSDKTAYDSPERIILKKHFRFNSDSRQLKQNHLVDLKKFAALLKSNHHSKLIISLGEENSKALMNSAVKIMDHLSLQQGISKHQIYIQTAATIDIPDRYQDPQQTDIIELKLIKSFWTF